MKTKKQMMIFFFFFSLNGSLNLSSSNIIQPPTPRPSNAPTPQPTKVSLRLDRNALVQFMQNFLFESFTLLDISNFYIFSLS